jgi:hypothetical protein
VVGTSIVNSNELVNHMTRSAQFSFGFAVLATILQTTVANAQDAGKAVGGLQIAQVSGTMQAMALDKIKIVAEDKKEYFAVVSPQTSLSYKGTAEPDFLMPGMLIRFSAELNQAGQVQSPVAELEVFTISQHRRMSQEQMRDQTAGVYQVGGEVGNAKKPGDKPNEKSSKPNVATSKGGAQAYRVVGQIAGMKAGKMLVQAGGAQVQLELDPKAVIKVTSHDTTFCQMGDQVKVSGLRNAGQEQFIQSESLEIVGSKPLGPAEGKTAKNAKTAKGAKGKTAKAGAVKDKDDATDDNKTEAKSDAKKTTAKK